MEECNIPNLGRVLMTEETKWFVYSYYFKDKMSAIKYLSLIKDCSFIKLLKINNIYQITGARDTKKTFIDSVLHRFIILKTNAKEYAESLFNFSELDYKVHLSSCNYQRDENVYLELLGKILNNICDYEMQYVVGNYRIDFYIPKYKIAIEFDESYHYNNDNQKKDNNRQIHIECLLGCEFYRIDERSDILSQIDNIAKIIIKKITGIAPCLNGRFITESYINTILDIVTDFDLYFEERNKAAIGSNKINISLHDKFMIEKLEEKMAFAIDMGYITSFDSLIKELRKVWEINFGTKQIS